MDKDLFFMCYCLSLRKIYNFPKTQKKNFLEIYNILLIEPYDRLRVKFVLLINRGWL